MPVDAVFVPVTVIAPPLAFTVSAPVAETMPVVTPPLAVVIDTGEPLASIVPEIELTSIDTAPAPPLNTTLSAAERSPVLPAAVIAPEVVWLNVRSAPAPAADSDEPAARLRVNTFPASLL